MDSLLRIITDRLWERFSPEVLGTTLGEGLANLLTAGITFLVFYAAWRGLRIALRVVLGRTRLDETTVAFVHAGTKYAVLAVGAIAAVGELGIHTPSLVASLGVAGLTLGFAARDSLSNVISGLFIYWDRPFVIHDLVEVGGKFGRVERITLRSTRVVTPDGKMLAIPNSEMVNTPVASYTNAPHLRIDVPVNVGPGESLQEVREVLLGVVADDPDYLASPEPKVAVTELGDYAVTLQIQAWLDDEREGHRKRSELRERVFEALSAAGIEMPYETLQLEPVEVRQVA